MTKRVVIARPDYKRITKAVVEWENRTTDLTSLKNKKNPLNARTVLLQIESVHPDSPSSGTPMFRGTASYGSAVREDVTIKIVGLSDSETTGPSYGEWSDIPPVGGIPIKEEWIGETESHREIVYYAIGMLVMI